MKKRLQVQQEWVPVNLKVSGQEATVDQLTSFQKKQRSAAFAVIVQDGRPYVKAGYHLLFQKRWQEHFA